MDHSRPAPKSVAGAKLIACGYAVLVLTRPLTLAALFEPDLNRLGLTRANLIDTAPTQYQRTLRWARALHEIQPGLDGMIWTSRRCDPDLACVFLGDRGASTDPAVRFSRTIDPASAPALFRDIRAIAARAGIMIERP